jgi:uncharacterized Zn finger protein (UPF0148 family)
MKMDRDEISPPPPANAGETQTETQPDSHCPVCGAALLQEKCKVVCRSPRCTYRIVFNCSEF